jgi:hypothetical protein
LVMLSGFVPTSIGKPISARVLSCDTKDDDVPATVGG